MNSIIYKGKETGQVFRARDTRHPGADFLYARLYEDEPPDGLLRSLLVESGVRAIITPTQYESLAEPARPPPKPPPKLSKPRNLVFAESQAGIGV